MAIFQITYKPSSTSPKSPGKAEMVEANMSNQNGGFRNFFDEQGLVLAVPEDRIEEVRRIDS